MSNHLSTTVYSRGFALLLGAALVAPLTAQCGLDGCCTDAFDQGPAPAAAWTLGAVGGAQSVSATVNSGRLELSGAGLSLYRGPDEAAFLYQTLGAGDFRIETTLGSTPSGVGGDFQKGGLMLRSGLDPEAARIFVALAPDFPDPVHGVGPAIQFDVRSSPNGDAQELASTSPVGALPVDLAIQRRGGLFSVYFRAAGETSWTRQLGGLIGDQGAAAIPALDGQVLAGLVVSSNDPSTAVTYGFEDFSVCRPDGTINDPALAVCDPGAVRDLTFLVDLSGSLRRAAGHSPFPRLLDGQLAAYRLLNRSVEILSPQHRVSVVDYAGFTTSLPDGTLVGDPAWNQSGGARISSPYTFDFSSVDQILRELEQTDPVTLACDPDLRFLVCDDDWVTEDCCDPTTTAARGLVELGNLFDGPSADTTRSAAAIWLTDNRPNVDLAGFSLRPSDAELGLIDLFDDFGYYVDPLLTLAERDCFYPSSGLCRDAAVADAMDQIRQRRTQRSDLRFLSLLLDDGVGLPLNGRLLDFAAFYSGGATLLADADQVLDQVPELMRAIHCGADGNGALDGTVWHDVDADRQQDPDEPGLAGVQLTVGGQTVTTDSDGRYSVVLAPGTYGVTLDPSTLPTGIAEATYDPDGKQSPGSATLTVESWRLHPADFGFADVDVVFCDGFESGDTARWTSALP